MLPEWDNPQYPERSLKFKKEPSEVRILIQRFGGTKSLGVALKVKTKTGKTRYYSEPLHKGGKRIKGTMEYLDITDKNKVLTKEIMEFLKQKISEISL